MDSSKKYTVTHGGWYQRTTLHLSEVYDLLASGRVDEHLDTNTARTWFEKLGIVEISREAGYIECVRAVSRQGILIRYYEDGLYVLELEASDVQSAERTLKEYLDTIFNPSIAFIFSRGAPTPKLLAHIQTAHPTVVSFISDNPTTLPAELPDSTKTYSVIRAEGVAVHKTPGYIYVVSANPEFPLAALVEMQIFFREFKDQLEKYLKIHRNIWEEISLIKEQKTILGRDVEELRSRLDGYQKTISLITNRINQMGSYIRTRASFSKKLEIEERLRTLFEYKFEALTDTLDYIKEIWKMTNDYLNSAIAIIVEIKNQGTSRGIQSLQVITSIGVISTIIGFLAKDEWPKLTGIGALYFALIIFVTWLVNVVVAHIYRRRTYTLKFTERAKDL